MKFKRSLTVYKKIRFYKGLCLIIPEIRLKGNWLIKWGFDCVDKIIIIKMDEGLILLRKNGEVPTVEI